MIKALIFCLIFFIPFVGVSQNLRVGLGMVTNEDSFNQSVIQIDSITVFEGNLTSSDPVLFPSLAYHFQVSTRLSSFAGIQYYRNYISLVVNKPVPDAPVLPRGGKVRSASNRNFEFPLGLEFSLLHNTPVKLKINGALVPVWSASNVDKLDHVPEGPDWSQEVVDALNAVETVQKGFYMNYQYGLSLEYKRIGLILNQNANINQSISEGYTLYGNTYDFRRRIRSTRLGIYYSIGLKKDFK